MTEGMTYKSLKGHLATITSPSEEMLIRSLGLIDKSYWIGAHNDSGMAMGNRRAMVLFKNQ